MSTASWLPLRFSRDSSVSARACTCAGVKVAVKSTTRPVSGIVFRHDEQLRQSTGKLSLRRLEFRKGGRIVDELRRRLDRPDPGAGFRHGDEYPLLLVRVS